MSARDLQAKLYDALVSFNTVACWDVLKLAQMREYLAEHLAGELRKGTSDVTQAAAGELTIYRASHDAIVMGHYTTRDAAQDHCLTSADNSDLHNYEFTWHDDEDGGAELWATFSSRSMPERPTGYVVTPVPVASEYDEEDDE
ncbi:hypothetical protein PV350_31295 [Streptomyces sp. PA03-6a]|nr:hypothetical protein [Streptomyces sp. PA03-6a]